MREQLGKLKTDLGERSTYDAASQCSRCGYCEQACPTYVATGAESKSPRGRNQLVRLMLEGKLNDPASAREALSTCLLCGACATTCYAHVPTADIVLEGRRRLAPAPRAVRWLCGLLLEHPRRLELILKAANFLKRLGLSRLVSRSGLLGVLGLDALAEADLHVAEAPARFLGELLRAKAPPEKAESLYFAACGPNYLFPTAGEATARACGARFLDNACCGLLAYNYGELEDARALARRNIENLEAQAEPAPVVADCSSCAAFLKGYPQLFLDDASWKARAEAFSARVKDAVEVLPAPAAASWTGGTVTYHDSCRARHGQGLSREPRELMRGLFGDAYVELPEADVCCGGAGAYSFTEPELSEEVLKRKIGAIAGIQARLVATSSTSCLIQLARGLAKYYPECRVAHISELVLAKPES
jgi:glycolate oxidase iron-sulfur subunit